VTTGVGDRRLIGKYPRVQRPADRPEMIERGDRETPTRDAEQPDGRVLELVEATVVEGVFQWR